MNQVELIGRVTKDIELRYTPSQMAVARLSIAIDRGKDKEGNSRGADFPSLIAFGKTAEFLEKYVGKGNRVAVVGHIQTGSYEKDGVKHYTTDVIVDKVEPIDWKEKTGHKEDVPDGFSALDDLMPF